MNPFTSFFSLRRSYWAALAAGVGLLLISVGSKVYFWHFAHNSLTAAGTVTAIEVNEDGYSCPIYRYEASDLRIYEVKSGSCHKPAAYRVGDRITVLYDRKDHGDAYIEQEMKSDPILELECGASGLAVAFLIRWYAKRKNVSLRFW